MIFFNYNKIATTGAKKRLLKLVDRAIGCVQPKQFIPGAVKLHGNKLSVKGKDFSLIGKRVFVIGIGKASVEMALEIEKILGPDRITAGLVITNRTIVKLKKIKVHLADHPLPSARGWQGAKKIFALKKKYSIGKNDLIIALVSGGGSALAPYPVSGVSLVDKKKLYDLFIKHGVTGFKSTIIKTKISSVKGGGLAKHFFPAQVISLILSDDNGQSGDEFTSSGPFTHHPSTFADALKIIDEYKIRGEVPKSIISFLEKNRKNKKEKSAVNNVKQFVLASNKILLAEINKLAKKQGWIVKTKNNIAGEVKDVAREFCTEINHNKKTNLLLYGGETTVKLSKSHGVGGRNQEFVVACLKYLKNAKLSKPWALASIATDGIDFIKQSAGGMIDGDILKIIKNKNIDVDKYLSKHDFHNLLKSINSNLFVNNSTGTNVGDIMAFSQL
ncbi:DUF4147 domain-containing protein [Candidatus Wolfebacteria bacterium]|nr:DUF4147 domain-containing protein [Candidatus Wolfebacteria bacterium]